MKKLLLVICIIIITTNLSSCHTITNSETPSIKEEKLTTKESSEQFKKTPQESTAKLTPTLNTEISTNTTAIGGSSGCQIHDRLYHSYSDTLINYIGEEAFYEWHQSTFEESDTGCLPNRNFYSCIEHFEIPKDVIVKIYCEDYFDSINWNIEALLARDKEAFEYSSRLENIDQDYSDKMTVEMLLKYNLFDCLKQKKDENTVKYFNDITDNGSFYRVCEITIFDMVKNTSLTREEFENALKSATTRGGEAWSLPHFEYDLDLLFGDTGTLTKMIDNLDVPYYESRVKMADALLHVGEKSNDHVAY